MNTEFYRNAGRTCCKCNKPEEDPIPLETGHKQIPIENGKFTVDKGIAPVVKWLRRMGAETVSSCESDNGKPYVQFKCSEDRLECILRELSKDWICPKCYEYGWHMIVRFTARRGRWYVLANDRKDNTIKTFGLDRISQLEISRELFKYPEKLIAAMAGELPWVCSWPHSALQLSAPSDPGGLRFVPRASRAPQKRLR